MRGQIPQSGLSPQSNEVVKHCFDGSNGKKILLEQRGSTRISAFYPPNNGRNMSFYFT
jgi:hypothetical protein